MCTDLQWISYTLRECYQYFLAHSPLYAWISWISSDQQIPWSAWWLELAVLHAIAESAPTVNRSRIYFGYCKNSPTKVTASNNLNMELHFDRIFVLCRFEISRISRVPYSWNEKLQFDKMVYNVYDVVLYIRNNFPFTGNVLLEYLSTQF